MKQRILSMFTAVALAVSLSACTVSNEAAAQNGQGGGLGNLFSGENIGTLLGAAGGAVAGSQFGKGKGNTAMTAVGTLGGAVLGRAVGSSMDRGNAAYAAQQNQARQASQFPQPAPQMPGQYHQAGQFQPMQQFQPQQVCREYTQTIVIGGQVQETYGTACRQPDGTWRVVQ